MRKIPVGILGATGAVGQKFALLLHNHPWFEVRALAASQRSAGKTLAEAQSWHQADAIPADLEQLQIVTCEPHEVDCPIVFSGLDSSVAGEVEVDFARAGCWVFSNAKNHRMGADIPLLIAELNPDHLELIPVQQTNRGWNGAIVTNANCSAIVLTLALGPIHRAFGLESVQVTTFQAISGAGYPGVPALAIQGNVIPYIPGEEEKIETEPLKILGRQVHGNIVPASFSISAQANRVPVREGHFETVSLSLREEAGIDDVVGAWESFESPIGSLELPSAPRTPILVRAELDRPQPFLDVDFADGMPVQVGRVRECPILDIKFVLLGHNTVRGAAGASILNAELAVRSGRIPGIAE